MQPLPTTLALAGGGAPQRDGGDYGKGTQVQRVSSTTVQRNPSGHVPLHDCPRNPQGRAVDVVVLVVRTLVELVLVVGGGGLLLVVVGRMVVVVARIVVLVGRMVVVVARIVVLVGGLVVELVVEPRGSVPVVMVVDVLLVALVVLVTFVLLVTLVLVGPVPGGRLVVVLVATIGDGQASGAGAFRATKRPGLSLPILPPKRRQ